MLLVHIIRTYLERGVCHKKHIEHAAFRERLRACRIARKQTMKEFAELCGISERYLADIERGVKAPRLETFVGIANAAGISPEYLLQDSLTAIDEGKLVRDALNTMPRQQQELFQDFIIQLAESMK